MQFLNSMGTTIGGIAVLILLLSRPWVRQTIRHVWMTSRYVAERLAIDIGFVVFRDSPPRWFVGYFERKARPWKAAQARELYADAIDLLGAMDNNLVQLSQQSPSDPPYLTYEVRALLKTFNTRLHSIGASALNMDPEPPGILSPRLDLGNPKECQGFLKAQGEFILSILQSLENGEAERVVATANAYEQSLRANPFLRPFSTF